MAMLAVTGLAAGRAQFGALAVLSGAEPMRLLVALATPGVGRKLPHVGGAALPFPRLPARATGSTWLILGSIVRHSICAIRAIARAWLAGALRRAQNRRLD
jgi:hypothetical protein